jgi:hypothetical protein
MNFTDCDGQWRSVIKESSRLPGWSIFSGKTPIAIEQDFYSRIIMLNLSSMIETEELQPQLDKTDGSGHRKQVNRTQVMLKLKEFAFDIFWTSNDGSALSKMLQLLHRCHDIIRPDRHYKRYERFGYKRKPLYYKA